MEELEFQPTVTPTPTKEVKVKKDPIAEKVKDLQERGYDNNRIAAMLGLDRKTIIDKIK